MSISAEKHGKSAFEYRCFIAAADMFDFTFIFSRRDKMSKLNKKSNKNQNEKYILVDICFSSEGN